MSPPQDRPSLLWSMHSVASTYSTATTGSSTLSITGGASAATATTAEVRRPHTVTDFSYEHLQERMQQFLETTQQQQQQNQQQDEDHKDDNKNHNKKKKENKKSLPKLVMAVAGGGGHWLSCLSSTPGASRVLLEGSQLYDRESYLDFVMTNGKSSELDSEDLESFHFCSREAAAHASQAALNRALQIVAASSSSTSFDSTATTPVLETMQTTVGIACASALASAGHKSLVSRGSRAYICVSVANSSVTTQMAVHLGSSKFHSNNNNNSNNDKVCRTRFDEDVFVSHAIMTCLEHALNGPSDGLLALAKESTAAGDVSEFHDDDDDDDDDLPCSSSNSSGGGENDEGDLLLSSSGSLNRLDVTTNNDPEGAAAALPDSQELANTNSPPPPPPPLQLLIQLEEWTDHGDRIRTEVPVRSSDAAAGSSDRVIIDAAQRILSGTDQVVALVPSITTTTTNEGTTATATSTFVSLSRVALPSSSLIFPGSFNPPHVGHMELAKAALHASRKRIVWFELSLTNADKPSLSTEQVVNRVKQFLTMPPFSTTTTASGSKKTAPEEWGILLTNAPLFRDKVDKLYPMQVYSRMQSQPQNQQQPLYFSIGTDTLVRLLNPKYYDHSESNMLQTLRNMPCHFVVGGRLEQQPPPPPQANSNSSSNNNNGTFVTGQEQIAALPPDLQSKFTLLSDFRVDISSTELRKQQEQQQQQQQQQL